MISSTTTTILYTNKQYKANKTSTVLASISINSRNFLIIFGYFFLLLDNLHLVNNIDIITLAAISVLTKTNQENKHDQRTPKHCKYYLV